MSFKVLVVIFRGSYFLVGDVVKFPSNFIPPPSPFLNVPPCSFVLVEESIKLH